MGVATTDDVTIAIMGATGTGKSTFVNMLSNSGFAVGNDLLSCTPAVQVSREFQVSGRRVKLIDTPGFDDTLKSDRDILKLIASFLEEQYRSDHKLHGVIYMHRISDIRMSGISRRNFNMFRSLCGETSLKNVIIATNMWGEVDEATGAEREQQLKTDKLLFKPALDSGARMMRHSNTLLSAQAIIDALLANHPRALQIQSELVDEHRALEDTVAGAQLEEALKEAKRQQEAELRKQKEAADAARRAQEEQARRQKEEARRQKEAAEARAREEHERFVARQREEMLAEQRRLAEVQRQLEVQAEARRQEEERVRQLELERQRQAAAAEAERQRQQAALEEERQRQRRRRRRFRLW